MNDPQAEAILGLKVGSNEHASFGTVVDFQIDGNSVITDVSDLPAVSFPVLDKVSFTVDFKWKPGPFYWRMMDEFKRLERARFRQMRPARKAFRRGLSRNRIDDFRLTLRKERRFGDPGLPFYDRIVKP